MNMTIAVLNVYAQYSNRMKVIPVIYNMDLFYRNMSFQCDMSDDANQKQNLNICFSQSTQDIHPTQLNPISNRTLT